MKFEIDTQYLTSVTVIEEGSMYAGKKNLTDDELVKVLKGEDRWKSTRSDDHPEFKKLRNELESQGYIKTQRAWWNGDEVLKPFTLNGYKFFKNEKFPCSAAITGHMKYHRN